jgi:hypothetical protein
MKPQGDVKRLDTSAVTGKIDFAGRMPILKFVHQKTRTRYAKRWRRSNEYAKTDSHSFILNHHPVAGGNFRSDGPIPLS